jgi:hypothetical protein
VVAATVGCFGIAGLAARALLGQTLLALVASTAVGVAAFAVVAYVERARLQLAGLLAALLPGLAATGASQPDRQPA